jgi:CHASE3 domain sensor protein
MKIGSTQASSEIQFGVTIMGFVAVMIAMAATGLIAYWGLASPEGRDDRKAHIHLTIDHLQSLRFLLDEVETRERDYLISGDEYNLELYRTASARLNQELHLLETLNRSEPGQWRRMSQLAPLIRTRMSALKGSIQVRTQMGPESALEMIRSSSRRSLMDDILRRTDDMIDEERQLLAQSEPQTVRFIGSAVHIIVGASVVGFVVLLLTALYIFRSLMAMRRSLASLSRNNGVLQTQSRLMDAVLDGLDEGVVVLDRDLKVVRSNPVAEQLLGANSAHIPDERDIDLRPPSPGDRLTLALEHFQTALPDLKNLETTEVSIGSPDKLSVTSIAASARALRDESGALQGGVLLFRDLTEHKSLESELEANEANLINLFHYGLGAALIAALGDSLYIGVNEAFLRLCDYSRDEILDRKTGELKLFADPAEMEYALDQVRAGQIVRNRALGFCAKSGRTFDALLSVLPIEFGGLACALLVLSGIEWRNRPSRLFRGLFQSGEPTRDGHSPQKLNADRQ